MIHLTIILGTLAFFAVVISQARLKHKYNGTREDFYRNIAKECNAEYMEYDTSYQKFILSR